MSIILEIKDIVKKFGAFTAINQVSLDLVEGEIHAILGENGAGKTTLMNVLYGLYEPTEGDIFLNQKKLNISSPMKAIELGIGMIHQHFMLIKAFTVLENIILGLESEKKPFLDKDSARKKIIRIANENNLTVDLDAVVADLSVGQQQQVEILKALYRGAKILILDEPTAVLTPQECVKLFRTLQILANQGHSILFISHKLDEVLEISNRISILRKGVHICTIEAVGVDKALLAELMVGRECELTVKKDSIEPGEVVLEAKNLFINGSNFASNIKNVSFEIRQGQIIGIAGVDGNGQRELIEGIAGLRKVESGSVVFRGQDITNNKPSDILECGIAFVPEDRNKVGSIGKFTLVENVILRTHHKEPNVHTHFIDYKYASKLTEEMIEEYDIRTANQNIEACMLSGGNLQKLIMAREIHTDSDLLLAMHPTRGLDVGAIEFVHQKLLELRENKKAIILVSTELDEIMEMSDIIVVLYNGEITGVVESSCIDKESIGQLMLGETNSNGRYQSSTISPGDYTE